MTRAAVSQGFERYIDRAVEVTVEAFSVSRALRRGTAGGGVVDRLLKNSDRLHETVVQPELDAYRRQVLAQFDALLDYVESDAGVEAHREALLAADAYADAIRPDVAPDRRATVEDRLVERQRRFGEAIAPVVAAEPDSFWPAVTAALTREQARTVVEEHFRFASPLREYRDVFRMAVEVDPADVSGGLGRLGSALGGLPTVEVEYTDEAVRALGRAEDTVVEETLAELERQFDDAA